MKNVFRYVNARTMFEDYLTGIPCRYLKHRGRNTAGKKLHFSEQEKIYILEGIRKMGNDIYKKYIDMPVEEIYAMIEKEGNQLHDKKA